MYSTRTTTVTVTYVDTPTEEAMHIVWLLCHMICHMMYVCAGEIHIHGLYIHMLWVRVTMDIQMVL